MPSSRFLIINADDLGISSEVNQGIRIAYEKGVITDSSLLIKGPYSKESIEMIKGVPSFRVGLHIDLDPLLGWESPGKERYPRQELLRMMNDPDFASRVGEEIDKQITAFLEEGLTPSHVDTHHHVHSFPQILLPLVEAMVRYEIKAIRFCRKGYYLMGRQDITLTPEVACWMEKLLQEKGIFYPHHFIDPTFPFSLKELPQGITELMVHPSTGGEPWRRKDFEMLMDPFFATTLGEEGIDLISFSELGVSLHYTVNRG
ncbi:MAG: ChbG/HpnK family deacetylase [Deltaproteobacteria bacterium]|nr:ChbG/HpnK family deacetylase [Deltaproteobacteria bacterium]